MQKLRVLVSRLRAVLTADRRDRDLHDEVQAHLDLLAADYERRGLPPAAARLAARRDFGGVDQIAEEYRDRRGLPILEVTARDLRVAARSLARQRGFAAVAILSLAVGIGGTTSVFSVLNAALLRPLPVPRPGELAQLSVREGDASHPFFNPDFETLRDRQRSLVGMFAGSGQPFASVSFDRGAPTYASVHLVSGNYFQVLGIAPAIGRLLAETDDDVPAQEGGAPCAAVIGHALWTARFHRDPAIVGHQVVVHEVPCTIVGVAPPGFVGHQVGTTTEMWLPLRKLTRRQLLDSHTQAFFSGVVGRLRPGVTLEQAEAELTTLMQQVPDTARRTFPGLRRPPTHRELRIEVASAAQGLIGFRVRFARPLSLVLAAVALVLLIAAANVATLFMARGIARLQELSTRAALGAGRWRLVRQLAIEGGMLAALGGVVGAALAWIVTPALAAAIVDGPVATPLDTSVDWRVLVAGLAATVVSAVICAVVPAVRLTSEAVHHVPRERQATGGRAPQRTLRLLVAAQFTVSLLLVTMTALLAQTAMRLASVDLGFDPGHVVTLQMFDEVPATLSASTVTQRVSDRVAVYEDAERRLNALPAVQSASLSWLGLFSRNDLWVVVADAATGSDGLSRIDYVSPRYFETVGMQRVSGRGFTADDRDGRPPVAVINEAFARERFAGQEAVGRQFLIEIPDQSRRAVTVVGVVRDSKYNDLREDEAKPMLWLPLYQEPYRISSVALRVTPGAEAAVGRAAEAELTRTDPYLMTRRVASLAADVGRTTQQERLLITLAAAFSLIAITLAAIGLYGTLAYRVVQRTREIGVRVALGAERAAVVRLVIADALRVVTIAALAGVPASLAVSPVLKSFLFGVTPADPASLVAALAVLGVVAVAAAVVPGLRASRVDPVIAMRQE